MSNGAPLPTFISFDRILLKFFIYTTNIADIGNYQVEVLGKTNDGFLKSVKFDVKIYSYDALCANTLAGTWYIPNYSYRIYDPQTFY